MDMCKGGKEPKYVTYTYRVEYMEAGHVKTATYGALDSVDAKEAGKMFHKNCKILSICLADDYKKLYEKYSDIMNPFRYER